MSEELGHILLVEDDDDHADIVYRSFRRSQTLRHQLTRIGSLKEAWEIIGTSIPDLVIADFQLPDGKGTDLLPQKDEDGQFPVVIMTSFGDEHLAVKALKSGALDYVVKSELAMSDMPRIAERALREWEHITRHRSVQKEMQQMRLYLKNILDSMPSILIGVDSEGTITQWNREAELYTRISSKEAKGKQLPEVFPRIEVHMDLIYQAINEKMPQRLEKVVDHINDETFYSDIVVFPLLEDRMEGAVIRIDDVTSRVRLEEIMVQTEKMMSIGGLAAGMAHEINNPLSGILQGVQIVIDHFSPDIKKNVTIAKECGIDLNLMQTYLEKRNIIKYLGRIKESGIRAAQIIDNMLHFSRRSESKRAKTNIANLINKTIELASSDYDLKKRYDFRCIEIIRHYDMNCPKVFCVATEIAQVVLNLLKNAAQAMHEQDDPSKIQQITIRIQKEGRNIRIDVEDNGPGMEEKVRKRVFEPFFTTKEVGIGTGLGLSVSYFIITSNHKGSMTVESSPGVGSKFSVYLPF